MTIPWRVQAGLVLMITAFLWAPGYLGAASILTALAALSLAIWPSVKAAETPPVIRRMPTAHERRRLRRRHTYLLPAIGVGVSAGGRRPRPFIFASLLRWRR